jgi:aldose 1-epimerase
MKNISLILLSCLALSLFNACQSRTDQHKNHAESEETPAYVLPDAAAFAREIDGKKVSLFILKNGPIQAAATNFGARMVSLLVPDKAGQAIDVIQGYASLDGYLNSNEVYFGAVVGRFGNRIAKGKFTFNGKNYQLANNNAPNHLHGGPKGFQNVVWEGRQLDSSAVQFSYLAKEGEEGYPGELLTTVTYRLGANGEVDMRYVLEAKSPTIANVTNHNFWNLDGERDTSINDHQLQIIASRFSAVDSTLIPQRHGASGKQPF